jgi:magnesium transporter
VLDLHTHPGLPQASSDGGGLDREAAWIDLTSPSEEEKLLVERKTGLRVPTLQQLNEVEISSRLRRSAGALYLSLPLVYRDENRRPRITPVGFLLTERHLVTVRFEELKAFETCRVRIGEGDLVHPSAAGIFVTLLEAIVDRLADVLEEVGEDLDDASDEVFGRDADMRQRRPKIQGQRLRVNLRRVGRQRQLLSKIRATLLAIGRLVPYVQDEARSWLPDDTPRRLDTVMHDVASLDEYESHLSDKVQFLLDADLGLINIEQNDTFRVLTVVSVVGIPPTLVASLYGMNFKNMPELNWTYGYVWGLGLILASALLPLVWFRVKGWF